MKYAFALVSLLLGSLAHAETFSVSVGGEPSDGKAILHVFENGSIRTKSLSRVSVQSGVTEVGVNKDDVGERPFFISIRTATGVQATSDVLSAGVLTSASSCDEQPTSLHKPEEQLTLINALVNIRERYHQDARTRLSSLITKGTIEDLSRLERLLGLSAPTPIRADMEPLELTRRLNRLVEAVRNYRLARNVTR